ncbi:MAG TPA: hypothetical protein VFH48_42310 [Chloroflexota bacterium]|nr:hypothetical protein [Chloroflexota bacterium]
MARDRTRQARRRFLQASLALTGLGLVAGCGVVPFLAPAPSVPRIGYLGLGSASDLSTGEFLAGLRDLGYVEGQSISIEWRYAGGRLDRLPELAAELVHLKPDILVAGGSTSSST